MSAYTALRATFPKLPDSPTPELTAYAAAILEKNNAREAHEISLAQISSQAEARLDELDEEDPNFDAEKAAIIKTANDETREENDSYRAINTKLQANVDAAFNTIPAPIRALMTGAEAELQPDPGAEKKIADYIATLDDATRELILDLNNQSASTSIDIAVGYIPKGRFLKLPAHLAERIYALWDSQPKTETYQNGLTAVEIIAIAAVNLSSFENVQGMEFMAMVRAYACAILGAPSSSRVSGVRFHEVQVVPAVTDPKTLGVITSWMKTNAALVKNMRYFVINFICLTNHVLLSLRSHWKNDPQFTAMWNNGLKGALLDNLLNQISIDRGILFHDVLHPWGLKVLYEAHKNFARSDICDNSMKLRFNGAACGTAAYTGAAALLEQMRATKLFDKFFETREKEIVEVTNIAQNIRSNRDRFSLNHRFYGHLRAEVLPTASVQAIAPVLMAYRDVFLKSTSFKDIRAISKVADNADGVRKILVEKMKTLVKAAGTTIDDIV